MNLKTIISLLLVCESTLFISSCATSNKVAKTYDTVEESEKALAKKRKKEAIAARKEQKAIQKAHWNNQSKAYKKSIKRNQKRMKQNAIKGRFVP